ncbi:MAG: hypothetical protein EZS28_054445 [Streblomastix strix]|uniref:Uncharacterized protein n=1 Tax=Streblomastix strix TaxID=222440 RepID=A0A5J4QKF6_9EUKA|nr:MAG: hypothetical protein EZS28_054445 [Streblomastix strix]
MYLQNESLAQSQDVIKFTESLYASFLRKEEFRHNAELHIAYAFFVQDYRPAMQIKLMRQAEESIKSGKGINEQGIGGNQLVTKSANDGSAMMDSKQHSINIQVQQADKQYEILKAHLIRVWSLLTRRSVDVDKS